MSCHTRGGGGGKHIFLVLVVLFRDFICCVVIQLFDITKYKCLKSRMAVRNIE